MNWLKKNFWELDRSPSLSYVGAIIAFLHALTYYFWTRNGLLGPHAEKLHLCWDFAPKCDVTAAGGVQLILFHVYLGLAVLACLTFLTRRVTKLAWSLLLLTFLFMLYFYIGNASLASDILAFFIVANIGFLFLPRKPTLLHACTLFYFFISGFRELNSDWLSGMSLHKELHLSVKGLEWVAAMSILFKWALPPLLLSTTPQQFAIGVVALLVFLFGHYWYLHDYQSLVLVFFVFIFVLDFFEKRRLERETMYQSYEHPEPSKVWWPVLFGIFIIAQTRVMQRFSLSGLIKIKGPAPTVDCIQFNYARYKNHTEQLEWPESLQMNLSGRAGRLHCSPKIAEANAKTFCAHLVHQPNFESLSTYLLTRTISQSSYRLTWHSNQACRDVN